jgi:hypothetical protein
MVVPQGRGPSRTLSRRLSYWTIVLLRCLAGLPVSSTATDDAPRPIRGLSTSSTPPCPGFMPGPGIPWNLPGRSRRLTFLPSDRSVLARQLDVGPLRGLWPLVLACVRVLFRDRLPLDDSSRTDRGAHPTDDRPLSLPTVLLRLGVLKCGRCRPIWVSDPSRSSRAAWRLVHHPAAFGNRRQDVTPPRSVRHAVGSGSLRGWFMGTAHRPRFGLAFQPCTCV